MPPRAKSAGTDVAELSAVLAESIRKAHQDGGQRATAIIDSAAVALKNATEALESRENHIKQCHGAVETLLVKLGEMVTSNKDLALIAANKEVDLAKLGGANEFKLELIKHVGPSLGPAGGAIVSAALRKMGIPLDLSPEGSKSDGTPDGDKREAAFATVQAIVTDEQIRDLILAKVGKAQWEKTVDYFLSIAHGGASASANGAAPN